MKTRTRPQRAILLVRPKGRRPAWWPVDGDRKAAWVTVNTYRGAVVGWSSGVDLDSAMPIAKIAALKKAWCADYPGRWLFMYLVEATA